MKRPIVLLFFVFAIVMAVSVGFAETVSIGSGTSTSMTFPIYASYNYSYTQQIYTRAQINQAGEIQKIRFYYVLGNIQHSNLWTIYMGHTTKTSFVDQYAWEPMSNLTQVYSGDVTSVFPATQGWMEITLDTPFVYNNVDNLIIAVDENKDTREAMSWGDFPAGGYMGLAYSSDGINPDPSAPPAANFRWTEINRIQLEFAPPSVPILDYSPSTIDFGDVTVGTSSPWQDVTIQNTGAGTLDLPLSSVQLVGAGAANFEYDNANLPMSLGASESATIPVRFSPTALEFYSAALQIIYGDGKEIHNVILSGNGGFPAINMTNGNYTLATTETVIFCDSGGQDLPYSNYEHYEFTFIPPDGWRVKATFSSYYTEAGCDYLSVYDGLYDTDPLLGEFSGSMMSPVLVAAQNKALTFIFDSDESVVYDGWIALVSVEPLPAEPVIAVNPIAWDFGPLDINLPGAGKVIEVNNNGGAELVISNIEVSGTGFSLENTPASYPVTIGVGESALEFGVIFDPVTVGDYNGTVTITHNAEDSKGTTVINLIGAGVDALISTFPWTETFEDDSLSRINWSQILEYGDAVWTLGSGAGGGAITTAHGGVLNARYIGTGDYDYTTKLVSPPLNLGAKGGYQLSFWYGQEDWWGDQNELTVYYRLSASDPWIEIGYYSDNVSTWTQEIIDLPEVSAWYQLAFEGLNNYGYPNVLDDISVYETFDIPADTPTEVAEGIFLDSNLNLNLNDLTIDNPILVSLPNYENLENPVFFGLTGTGMGDLEFELGPGTWYGRIYYGGSWHTGSPNPLVGPGTMTFMGVDFDAKGEVIAVFSDDIDPTLPVELSSFTAVLTGDMYVQIAWVAESETNHSGYNILRSESMDMAEAVKVNAALIEEGSSLGSQISYSFIDSEAYINMQYYYWLESVALDGVVSHYGPLTVTIGDPELDPVAPTIPKVTTLHNAFPNPFNPSTTIGYYMAEGGNVNIQIYNLRGQLMKSYTATHADQGTYYMSWDGRDTNGQPVGSGIYLYRMTSGNYSSTKKMVLSK